MILIDDLNNEEDINKARKILEESGIYVTKVISYADNFADTRWSVEDIDDIDEISFFTEKERVSFLKYAEGQIRSDMIEQGWESLKTIVDIYLKDEFDGYDINLDFHDYDIYSVDETGEDKYEQRLFNTTLNEIVKIYTENLKEDEFEIEIDQEARYVYWLHDDKNNKLYRIQLFQ